MLNLRSCGGRTLPLCDILEMPLWQVLKTCSIRYVNHDHIVSHWVLSRQVRNGKGPFAVAQAAHCEPWRLSLLSRRYGGRKPFLPVITAENSCFRVVVAGPMTCNLPQRWKPHVCWVEVLGILQGLILFAVFGISAGYRQHYALLPRAFSWRIPGLFM